MNKIYPHHQYILKFDGCSKGNPGKAGIGAYIYKNEIELIHSGKYIGEKTNNQAEYEALIHGLNLAIENNIDELLVMGDSELVIKQMKGEYKISSSSLIPLYNEAKQLESKFKCIEYLHIRRELNKDSDKLANIMVLYFENHNK